jgi:hypothetical protein
LQELVKLCQAVQEAFRRGQDSRVVPVEDTYATLKASQVMFDAEQADDERAVDEAEERGVARDRIASRTAGARGPVTPGAARAVDGVSAADLIPSINLRIESKMGDGAFGPVCKGSLSGPLVPGGRVVSVVVKAVDAASPENLVREAALMRTLVCPHLVQLFGVAVLDGAYNLVSEFAPLGAINKYLQTNKNSVQLPAILHFLTQVGLQRRKKIKLTLFDGMYV